VSQIPQISGSATFNQFLLTAQQVISAFNILVYLATANAELS